MVLFIYTASVDSKLSPSLKSVVYNKDSYGPVIIQPPEPPPP